MPIRLPANEIASCLLSQALDDPNYLHEARKLFAWEKSNLFNASSGAVYDPLNKSGSLGRWASIYNQGTFVGLANYLGDTVSAELAADYAMSRLGHTAGGNYVIMPGYGSGSGNNSDINSIGLRWIAKFMKDRNLQSIYLSWLQDNANTAWNDRRISDNVSWCQWFHQNPAGDLYSWDCINTAVTLQVTPPDETPTTL